MAVIKWEGKQVARTGNSLAVFLPRELHHIFDGKSVTVEWDGEKLIISLEE